MLSIILVIIAGAQELGTEDRVRAEKQDAFAAARCSRGEVAGCDDLLRAELSTVWARSSIAAPAAPLRRIDCDAPCEAGPDLPGQRYIVFDGGPSTEVLYAEVREEGLQVTLTRRSGEAFDILAEGEVDAPSLLTLLATRQPTRPFRAAWWENAPTVDTMVQPLPKRTSTWQSTRPVDMLTVVCPDAVRAVTPTLRRVRLGLRGYHTDRAPIYEYDLGCEASMVIGKSVDGPVLGPTVNGPHPARLDMDPEGTATLGALAIGTAGGSERLFRDCTASLAGRTVLQAPRSCSVPFAGDLNQDGETDFVLRVHGEIGCGVRDLWMSSPTGYRHVHSTNIGC